MSCADCQYAKGRRPHWPFPWPEPPEPTSIYTMPDEGPSVTMDFVHGGHWFMVTPTLGFVTALQLRANA